MTDEVPAQPKRMGISLRIKILIGFTLVFGIIFAIAYYWFYTYSTNMAMGRIREDLEDTLHGAIAGVDGDLFAAMVRENPACDREREDVPLTPETDPRYVDHQTWMNNIYQVEPRSIPYTYVPGPEPDTLLWVGDIFRITSPDEATCFLEIYTRTPESVILQGFVTNTVNMNPYPDDWGKWVSAYGPIKNSSGEIVGALGIDFRADYVLQVQQGILRSIVVAFLVTYGSLFVLVYLISTILTRPIVRLTKAAECIGEGDYSQDLTPLLKDRIPDEIDTLARTFNIMLDKVREREQTLRRQVEELRVEIDEVKRERQVSEITGSDFFRDLQERARTMRRRSQSQEEEKPKDS